MIDYDIFLIHKLHLLALCKVLFRLKALLLNDSTMDENGMLYLTACIIAID